MSNKKQPLVPALRFPEFVNDDFWEVDSLGNRGVFTGGGTPSKSNKGFWKGDIPWVSSSDIFEGSIHKIDISRFITEDAIKKSATKIIPKSSLLIVSRVGVGKIAVSTKEICTSQDFTNFTPKKDNLIFLGYYLKSRSKLLLNFSQGMAIKGFTKDDISSLVLSFPKSLKEQQKIANCLSSLDILITAETEKLDYLKEHKKGLLQQLFPANGETKPQYRFPEFENDGDWVEKSFEELFTIGNGRDYKHLSEGNIPVYGSGGYMRSVNEYIYDGESVCIGRKGTIDKPMFLTGKFWTVDTLFYTHSFKDCIPKFIYLIFQKINWLIHNEAGGVPSLSKKNLYKINVQIPLPNEQVKIVYCFNKIDALIKAQKVKIKTLKKHKKGLMQRLFPKNI